MKRNTSKLVGALSIGALLVVQFPAAAAAESDVAPRQRYMQERENCLAGRSHQPQDVCLREAGAALDAARRGQLPAEDPARLAANALARCDARPADQREMCERMARGEGTVSGSADSGGVVREIRVIVEEPAAAK